jgi:hypothetical protein
MSTTLRSRSRERRGQTLVETALVLPLFLTVICGILTFGIWIFYEQQIATVAREAARYAAVHSASSNCPVGGWLAPAPGAIPDGAGPWNCDSASAGWPSMTARGREFAFGMNPADVSIAACWAGYHDFSNPAIYDAGPVWANDGVTPNPWADCTMDGGTNPLTDTSSLDCPVSTMAPSAPGLLDGDDQASNLAVSDRELAVAANRVVVYACYNWSPPLAGFLAIPQTVVLRAVYSEALQHQR